jgi:hypothetical protein
MRQFAVQDQRLQTVWFSTVLECSGWSGSCAHLGRDARLARQAYLAGWCVVVCVIFPVEALGAPAHQALTHVATRRNLCHRREGGEGDRHVAGKECVGGMQDVG